MMLVSIFSFSISASTVTLSKNEVYDRIGPINGTVAYCTLSTKSDSDHGVYHFMYFAFPGENKTLVRTVFANPGYYNLSQSYRATSSGYFTTIIRPYWSGSFGSHATGSLNVW